MPTSLKIILISLSLALLGVFVTESDFVTNESSLVLRIALWGLNMFLFLGFIPATVGLIFGIVELNSKQTLALSMCAVAASIALLVAYLATVVKLWHALMGI